MRALTIAFFCLFAVSPLPGDTPAVVRLTPPYVGEMADVRAVRVIDIEAFDAQGQRLEQSRVEESALFTERLLAVDGAKVVRLAVKAHLTRKVTPGPRTGKIQKLEAVLEVAGGRVRFRPEPKGHLRHALHRRYRTLPLPFGQLGPFRLLSAAAGRKLEVGASFMVEPTELRAQVGELSESASVGLTRGPIGLRLHGTETVGGRACHVFTLRVALDGTDRKQKVHGVIESEYLWDVARREPCLQRVRISLELLLRRGRARRVLISGTRVTEYARTARSP